MTAQTRSLPPRQIVSIWLPHLAINRWERHAPDDLKNQPVVLTTESAHGPRIFAHNIEAQRAGAVIGQRLADARAMAPGIVTVQADPEGDHKTLGRLALWTQRWGPWSMVDGDDAILLDVTGASHLAGGDAALLADISCKLTERGFTSRPAMAATAGAGWALSHYGGPHQIAGDIVGENNPMDILGELPVAALRLEPQILVLLRRLGLKTIADLARVPRDSLARRFRDHRNPQTNPLIRLDQLLGKTTEPMIPLMRDRPPKATRRLAEPILHRSLLDQILYDLITDICATLEAQRLGTRRLELRCYRVDGDIVLRLLELASATRDAAHIIRLFGAKLDDIDAGFGIDQIDMISTWSQSLALAQGDLDSDPVIGTSFAQMLDRISARLGKGAVRHPVAYASHIPERSVAWIDAGLTPPAQQHMLRFYERPIKLLERPEPISVIYATPQGMPRQFQWRGKAHDITCSEGPERIAPEWWRERSSVRLRDYYRIEVAKGARYWIYRNGLIGDGRGGAPDWYLHGMFA